MIIAVDFDDTIAYSDWPTIVGPVEGAVEYINKLYDEGHQIIIWTCREGEHKQAAIDFLEEQGIKYHRINENCPDRTAFYNNDSRKIGADLYIDDKGIMGIAEWSLMYHIVTVRQRKINALAVVNG